MTEPRARALAGHTKRTKLSQNPKGWRGGGASPPPYVAVPPGLAADPDFANAVQKRQYTIHTVGRVGRVVKLFLDGSYNGFISALPNTAK